MRPGMNCGIEILVEEIPDAIYAPLQAIVLSKGKTIAFVAQGGRIEERPVVVGKQSDKWVQILEGLAEGDEVLLTPPPGYMPQKQEEGDSKVRVPNTPAAPGAQAADKPGGGNPGGESGPGGVPTAERGPGGENGAGPGAGRAGRGRRGDGQRPPGAGRTARGDAASAGAPGTPAAPGSPVAPGAPAKQDSASPGGGQSGKP
jgi:hypothetical protein